MTSGRRKLENGFTIIELLLVIAIIGVLTTLALGVIQGATEDAKIAATKVRIQQVESILAIEMEDYEVRRLPISVGELAAYAFANPVRTDTSSNPIKIQAQVRNLRRRILQDLISAEWPRPLRNFNGTPNDPSDDYFTLNPDVGVFPTTQPGVGATVGFSAWLTSEYSNAVNGIRLRDHLAGLRSAKTQVYARSAGNTNFDLPGEYLYAVLTTIDIDGERGVDLLPNNAISDSDGDGFLEIVDAWGDPMALVVYQVEAVNPPVDPDVYLDVDDDASTGGNQVNYTLGGAVQVSQGPDFSTIDEADGLPVGYTVLDPTVPRDLGKIKFEVLSNRMGRNRN